MPATDRDRLLMDLLAAQPLLAQRDVTIECGQTGGIVVSRWGHVRGVWHWNGKAFGWLPSGYREPTHFESDEESALRYTLVVLAAR